MDGKNKRYGEIVYTTVSGITNVVRIQMFGDQHVHFSQLIHSGKLYFRTDQDEFFNISQSGSDLKTYDSVYFNGILIYKRSLFRKTVDFFIR